MRTFTLCALMLLVVGLVTTPSLAFFIGESMVTIDGEQFVVPLDFDAGLLYFSADGGTSDPNGGSFNVSGSIDPGEIGVDPAIMFGLAVTDFGAPSAFGLSIAVAIAPLGSPNTVAASIGGQLTDSAGDGMSITPIWPALLTSTVGLPNTSMGVDVGPAASFGPGLAGAVYEYGPYVAGPQAGPGPGPWTWLTSTCSFDLSGGGDTATLNGAASIVPGAPAGAVPEPATVGLVLLGLAGLGARRARRRRHA